jgi:hypothetical protein
MSRMGMGIPSSHNKIYPVAPASLILCFKVHHWPLTRIAATEESRVSEPCVVFFAIESPPWFATS